MTKALNSIKLGKVLLSQWDWGLFLLIFLYMALPRFYLSYVCSQRNTGRLLAKSIADCMKVYGQRLRDYPDGSHNKLLFKEGNDSSI